MSGTEEWDDDDGDRHREVVNPTRGFGFIEPDNGGQDAFVHISTIERTGLSTLNEGQKVSYELVADKRSGTMCADEFQVG